MRVFLWLETNNGYCRINWRRLLQVIIFAATITILCIRDAHPRCMISRICADIKRHRHHVTNEHQFSFYLENVPVHHGVCFPFFQNLTGIIAVRTYILPKRPSFIAIRAAACIPLPVIMAFCFIFPQLHYISSTIRIILQICNTIEHR